MVIVEHLKECLEKIKKDEKKINAFIQLKDEKELIEEAKRIDEKIKKGKAGKLAGKIIAIKSNINVKGLKISCASKTLEDYYAPYNATVVEKILAEDGLIIGMANMDEFACGSSGETSAFGPARNPVNTELIPGGSSSGSACSVAAEFCDMSLGSDTGGSIRVPASNCGVVGIKPTYATVSRYGLIDLAMSLDQIGPFARNVSDASVLLDVMRGEDEKDSICKSTKKFDMKKIEQVPKQLKIGILDFKIKDERISKLIKDKVQQIAKKQNWQVKDIKIKDMDVAIDTYYSLVYVEFFSATRRFDGRRYGKRIEDSAGEEVLRRILGGAEISKEEQKGRYYYTALKVREMIKQEFSKAFKDVDCIICPTTPKLPHKIGEKVSVQEMYEYDALTVPSNLAGNCAITMPVGEVDKIPIGMQIICDEMQDEKMLQIARSFEKLI